MIAPDGPIRIPSIVGPDMRVRAELCADSLRGTGP
jgi:hypothetical protein